MVREKSRKGLKSSSVNWDTAVRKKHIYKPATLRAAEKSWGTSGLEKVRVDHRPSGVENERIENLKELR
jgi:hypothetical protein